MVIKRRAIAKPTLDLKYGLFKLMQCPWVSSSLHAKNFFFFLLLFTRHLQHLPALVVEKKKTINGLCSSFHWRRTPSRLERFLKSALFYFHLHVTAAVACGYDPGIVTRVRGLWMVELAHLCQDMILNFETWTRVVVLVIPWYRVKPWLWSWIWFCGGTNVWTSKAKFRSEWLTLSEITSTLPGGEVGTI